MSEPHQSPGSTRPIRPWPKTWFQLFYQPRNRQYRIKVSKALEKPKTRPPVSFPPNYCSSLIEHHKIKSFQQRRSVKAFSGKDTSETWWWS
jgi:hypothetical protein